MRYLVTVTDRETDEVVLETRATWRGAMAVRAVYNRCHAGRFLIGVAVARDREPELV